MSRTQNTAIRMIRAVLDRTPARWLPYGTPDPLIERTAVVGQRAVRLDAPLKVRGQAIYAAEVAMDRLAYTTLVHSTITRGRISRIDTSAAEASPGVLLAMTYLTMPRLAMVPTSPPTEIVNLGNSVLPIMQDPEIRYNGQVVAAVVAETQEQADHAASLIEIDYAEERARTSFADAKVDARTPASILFDKNHESIGDAELQLKRARYRVDEVYRTPPLNHNAIELHALTVAWDGDTLVVHDSTQAIGVTVTVLAKVFGLKKEQVRIHSPFVGGGFGAKTIWDHQIIAAAAAKLIGRPVRLMLSREGVYRIIGGRTPSEQRVAIGADSDGRFTSVVHTGFSVMPPYSVWPETYTAGTRSAYRSDSFEIVQRQLDLDVVANTAMRAPGEAIGTFAVESAVDELAHTMGIDPVDLRLRNLPERHPILGQEFSQHAIRKAWIDGADRFGWKDSKEWRADIGTRRDGEWSIGIGCAGGCYPYVRQPAKVRLTLRGDGTATVTSSAQEPGVGVATIQAQHAADLLGLPLECVTVELGDSALPAGPSAGASAQTASYAAALTAAADMLTKKLLRLASNDSPIAGLRPGQVRLVDGGITGTGEPGRHESFGSILTRAGRDEMAVTASTSPPVELLKYAMHSTSAVFCSVRVSTVTGEVRVDRLLGSFDCGTILNPRTATSQFKGGMIMGMGMALTEETLFDERSGRIMNPSLADYHIPAHLDVPDIEVLWTGIPDPRTPLGARGVGEIGVTGVAAAIANAVFNATGKRVRDLPITLDKLL
jgi:xanthine dehydrogenase YagR molybdenum-binding subunit